MENNNALEVLTGIIVGVITAGILGPEIVTEVAGGVASGIAVGVSITQAYIAADNNNLGFLGARLKSATLDAK